MQLKTILQMNKFSASFFFCFFMGLYVSTAFKLATLVFLTPKKRAHLRRRAETGISVGQKELTVH